MKHPAKYSKPILVEIEEMLETVSGVVLDPFAGTGRIHLMQRDDLHTVGVEIEPEWATLHPQTVVGDALHLPFNTASFDAVVTSPTYGNRMADHHDAKDGSKRNTYKHTLGRDLHPNNSGQMNWGEAYREFHRRAYAEIHRVLKSDGVFIVNISNHIRKGVEIDVVGWTLETLDIGFDPIDVRTVQTDRYREGSNSSVRVSHEVLVSLRPQQLSPQPVQPPRPHFGHHLHCN